jgi:hypothetical protein
MSGSLQNLGHGSTGLDATPTVQIHICHPVHSTNRFECYCWQKFTTVSNTDLYLSYFDLSYIIPGHNGSIERGPTLYINFTFHGFYNPDESHIVQFFDVPNSLCSKTV